MSTEQKKAVARRFIEASATNDRGTLKELLAPDFVAHQAAGRQDREAFLQHLNDFLTAFGDNHFAVEEQIAEGDKVVTRATWRATHSGDSQGVPPTGKEIAMRAMRIARIQDGKIVEHRACLIN